MNSLNGKFNRFVGSLPLVAELEIIFLDKEFLQLSNELRIHNYCEHLALSRKTKLYEINQPLRQDTQTVLFITNNYTLKLNYNSDEDLTNTINYFKNLKSIKLALNNLDKLEYDIFVNLFNSISSIRGLQELNLDDTKLIHLSNDSIIAMANSLGNMRSLQKLSLRHNNLNKIPENKQNSFLYMSMKLHRINNLNIANNNFANCSTQEFQVLCYFIGNMMNLKNLNLSCTNMGVINSKKLKILSKSLKSLPCLNNLAINNNYLNLMTISSVRQFVKLLINIKQLHYLSLFNCNLHLINPAYFDNILNSLILCENLSHLKLGDVGKFQIINLNMLLFYISRIKSLRILDLQHNQLDLLDELQTSTLGRNLINCKNLACIDFSNNRINFEDVLTEELEKSKSLRRIIGGQYNLRLLALDLSRRHFAKHATPILELYYKKSFRNQELTIAEFSEAIYLQKRISPIINAILGTTGSTENEDINFLSLPLELKYKIFSHLITPNASFKEVRIAHEYIWKVRKLK